MATRVPVVGLRRRAAADLPRTAVRPGAGPSSGSGSMQRPSSRSPPRPARAVKPGNPSSSLRTASHRDDVHRPLRSRRRPRPPTCRWVDSLGGMSMRSCENRFGSKLRRGLFIASLGIAGLAFGCSGSDGDPGPQGPPGPPAGAGDTATILDPSQDAPGVVIAITGVSGATGSGGTFQAGDTLTVTFTVKKSDGSPWKLSEMGVGAILASGPTANYTRVLKEKVNVISHATENADGSYSYQFED